MVLREESTSVIDRKIKICRVTIELSSGSSKGKGASSKPSFPDSISRNIRVHTLNLATAMKVGGLLRGVGHSMMMMIL